MIVNTMKQQMLKGEPVLGAELALGSPLIGEMFSLAGFDFVQVDVQHGMWTDDAAFQAFHHIRVGPATPAVRAPNHDYAAIGRLLDRGALTVVVPMVNSAEEARAVAQAVRYPPQGARSGGAPTGRMTYGADYANAANDQILLMVQIETSAAVDQAREILGVDGVDGCMIGPGDLGTSLGPNVGEAERERVILGVRDICRDLGKFPGIATGGTGAKQRLEEGFLFVLATGDYGFIQDGARDALRWMHDVRAGL